MKRDPDNPGPCMRYVLDDDGEPVPCEDLLTWAFWFETHQRALKQEHVGRYFVSTVFLGLDHAWGEGPPILWETMIFDDDNTGGRAYLQSWRYSTRVDALAGHFAAVLHARELVTAAKT